MFLHDRVRDGQSETGALADFFRREERIEDLAQYVLRHARPIVVDLEHDQLTVGFVPRPHDQRASSVRGQHRLLGVDDQIQQHLLNLMRVCENRRKP